jgi:hypothetical protein
MAAVLLSLRDIAFTSGRSYSTVKSWANDRNWPKPKVPVNRTVGRSAQYSSDEVFAFFSACKVAACQKRAA